MQRFLGVERKIFVIKVQYQLLTFESKFLVQKHGRVGNRYVKKYILAHTSLWIKMEKYYYTRTSLSFLLGKT